MGGRGWEQQLVVQFQDFTGTPWGMRGKVFLEMARGALRSRGEREKRPTILGRPTGSLGDPLGLAKASKEEMLEKRLRPDGLAEFRRTRRKCPGRAREGAGSSRDGESTVVRDSG